MVLILNPAMQVVVYSSVGRLCRYRRSLRGASRKVCTDYITHHITHHNKSVFRSAVHVLKYGVK